MSNLYTRLLGAITTAVGGITLCNYLGKYLSKTHTWLCHATKAKNRRVDGVREATPETCCVIYSCGG